jgi:exodeoxyribonuclease VII small subunit
MEDKIKSLTFEQALSRLETVVEAMEGDDTTLESAVALYKEGMVLSQRCNDILNRFESEVMVLYKETDGTFKEKIFDEGDQ